ncbi:hypothetical protein ACIBQ1_31155 [Nonomuraea sp. NPDC050153]|uniref:hypothetical protein n=1 Tax=Nonomuraea sp. NPDC050153 TaxID=3364359 RepID=UPI003794E232
MTEVLHSGDDLDVVEQVEEFGWPLRRISHLRPYQTPSGEVGKVRIKYDKEEAGVEIVLDDPDTPFVVRAAVVRGKVVRFDLHAREGAAITQRDLRAPALVSVVRKWAAIGERLKSEDLGPNPPGLVWDWADGTMTEVAEVTREKLASLAPPSRQQGQRKRGSAAEDLLRQVVEDYRAAVDQGDPSPRVTIAQRHGYSPAHIGRLLVKARRTIDPATGKPFLGKAGKGKAGEDPLELDSRKDQS